ncbi:MAG: hypothetical protein MjAS7_1725 [Metallosphaera javensis (ex Sakai et al. 2022)]|nr:MAG: hypothetical protein MjAS7_1725 [Metallosphaera javensis (ex Sakai et al. 2022)]
MGHIYFHGPYFKDMMCLESSEKSSLAILVEDLLAMCIVSTNRVYGRANEITKIDPQKLVPKN